jgi:hypothetical protein
VIEVGLKEYNFTWSDELGVCDIYEVCRNGEDGKGLLIERGSALRKMNVQRILDESAKNQVKMRSVQAELQSKSRKYRFFLFQIQHFIPHDHQWCCYALLLTQAEQTIEF